MSEHWLPFTLIGLAFLVMSVVIVYFAQELRHERLENARKTGRIISLEARLEREQRRSAAWLVSPETPLVKKLGPPRNPSIILEGRVIDHDPYADPSVVRRKKLAK